MRNGIVITTDGEIRIQDFKEPVYKTVGEAVGGWIENVHPMGLNRPWSMVVNEEGLLEGLPLNQVGSHLYGTHIHGQPIVGNIVIMSEGMTEDGFDYVRTPEDKLKEFANKLKEAYQLKGEI